MVLLVVAFLATHVLWQLATGRTWTKSGTPVYRKDNPGFYWGSVGFQIGGICLIVFVWYVYNPRPRSRPANAQQYAAAPRAAASGLASVSTAAPTTSPAMTHMVESPRDLRIKSRLWQRSVDIIEGREWKRLVHVRPSDRVVGPLIDQLYSAGAAMVFVDPGAGDLLPTGGPAIYVELPTNSHQRAACLGAAVTFEKSSPRSKISASSPTSERFIEIDLGG